MARTFVAACVLVFACAAARPACAFQNAPAQRLVHGDRLAESGGYADSAGQIVHAPARPRSGKPPDGATALCRDGSYSFSQHHQGTCSHHGGVARWL